MYYHIMGTHSNCFQITCVFPVQWQCFTVPIYIVCAYDIRMAYTKLTWQTYSAKIDNFHGKYQNVFLPLESGNLQLEQNKFHVFSMCFGKISKFPVFSLADLQFSQFSLCSGYPDYIYIIFKSSRVPMFLSIVTFL